MSESLDRRLDIVERMKLRLHLLVCAWCCHYLKQITLIRIAVRFRRDIPDESDAATIELSAAARKRISQSLKDSPH